MSSLLTRTIPTLRAKLLTREFRNTLLYVLSSAFGAVLGIVTLPLFSRYLSVDDFGTVGYVMSINGFLSPLFLLSLNSYYIKRYYAEPEPLAQTKLLSSLLYFTFGWTALCVMLFSLIGEIAFAQFGVKVPFFPYMFLLLLGNLALGPFTYATLQYRMRHQALGYAVLTIAQAALMAGIGLVLVGVYRTGPLGRINGLLYGSVIAGIAGILTLRRHLVWRFDGQLIREGLRFALPLIPVAVVGLLFDTIDRLFIERMSSLRDLGFYNVAMQYGSAIQILSLSIYRAYEPGYFEMAARDEFGAMNRSFIKVSGLFFAGVLLLMLLGSPVINLLTHGRFAASAPLANLLLVSFFLKAVYLLCNVLLATLGRTKLMMWTSLLGLLLFAGANYILLNRFGIAGAAYAKVLPMVVLIVLSVWLSGRVRQFRGMLLANLLMLAILTLTALVLNWIV